MTFPSFSVAYPPAQEGFWAPVTSTINWCEEDYYATVYSAEIVNTLTNLLFLTLGIGGIRNCIKYGHDRVFLLAFVGYLVVGSGSFLFHSTLKYPMQLIDELSMLYTALLMSFVSISLGGSRAFLIAWGSFFASFAVGITAYYHYCKDPVFHELAFGALTAFVILRSMYMMERHIRPSWRRKYATVQENQEYYEMSTAKRQEMEANDLAILKKMWQMVGLGLSIFLMAFGIWNLDTMYCSKLRSWRREIGLPWGILLEGHGWWHLMTGYGGYVYVVWAIWLRYCLVRKQNEYMLHWTSVFRFPEVVRISDMEFEVRSNGTTNGFANGSTKKFANGTGNGNGHTPNAIGNGKKMNGNDEKNVNGNGTMRMRRTESWESDE